MNASRDRAAYREQLHSFIPLRHHLPIEAWPRLRHFGISDIVVDAGDTIEVLASLPPTLPTVELSFLLFKEGGGGSYKEILEKIRYKLPWANWEVWPTLILKAHYVADVCSPMTPLYSKEATRFMHGEQEHLFGQREHRGYNSIPSGNGLGGVWRDEFDPTCETPCL